MRFARVAALLVFAMLPTLCVAQKKAKKPAVPEVLATSRFVFVEAVDGGEFDRNLYPADRMAIADVRDYLKAWGRYTIAYERDKAELIFVVRKGRVASADVNAGAGTQDPRSPSTGQPGAQGQRGQRQPYGSIGFGGDLGPPDDTLQICQFNVMNGKCGGPLWFRSETDGLDAPRIRLLAQFRDAVERAYPLLINTNPGNAPATPQSKP